MNEVVLDDRKLNFREQLTNVELALNRRGRAALTGEVAGSELLVNLERKPLLAIFGADVDADTSLGPRHPPTIFVADDRRIEVGDRLIDLAGLEAWRLQILQRSWSDTSSLKDVVRNAVRVDPGQCSSADDVAACIQNSVGRAADARDRKIVLVVGVPVGPAALIITVVGNAASDVTAHATHNPEGVVVDIVLTTAALDVPTCNVDECLLDI